MNLEILTLVNIVEVLLGRYVRPWSGFQIWLFRIRRRRKQGWCSGENTCLPPIWPRFESRRRRQMWVEFVVGSLLCSARFFFGCSGFPSPQKPTLPNSNSIWKAWTCLNEFILTPMCFVGKQAIYNFCFFKAMSLLVFNPSLCHSLSSFHLSFVTVSRPFHFSEIYPNRASL